jgi:hypothetical protein
MGQALSTTQRTIHVAVGEDRIIPDVERNEYCFTDGAGQISLALLREALQEMDRRRRRRRAVPWTTDTISALQVGSPTTLLTLTLVLLSHAHLHHDQQGSQLIDCYPNCG